jgi:hypothetical protein
MLPERSEVCLCMNHVYLLACKQSCLLTGEDENRCKCNETVNRRRFPRAWNWRQNPIMVFFGMSCGRMLIERNGLCCAVVAGSFAQHE